MGNCFSRKKGQTLQASKFSFSRKGGLWEQTGMVAFRNSNLREFPKQVEITGKKVRVLDGTNNKITEIPAYIELWTFCNRLALSKNRITEIPREIGRMTNLRVLLLDNNRLRSLPRAMFDLPKLERLNLSHNYIAEIPRSIRHLKSLKYLDVSSNKLVALPREIGELQSLEELHVSDNALARIPVDVAKLEKLRVIVAENNMIDALPSEVMLYCENLQTIALHGNPITIEKLEETKGYKEFEARRKAKWDKALAAGVLLGTSRFDESADRSNVSKVSFASAKLDNDTPQNSPGTEPLLAKKKKKKRRSSTGTGTTAAVPAHEVDVSAVTP